jgi:DNA-binding NarL/FixJ family response regulator
MKKRTRRRVAILYRDALVRDIVKHILGDSQDIQVVADLPATDVALADLIAARPDVLVIEGRTADEALPAALGSLLASLAEHRPSMRVIAVNLTESSATVLNGWQLPDLSADDLVAWVHGANPTPRGHQRVRPSPTTHSMAS